MKKSVYPEDSGTCLLSRGKYSGFPTEKIGSSVLPKIRRTWKVLRSLINHLCYLKYYWKQT